jgi:SAM-dependent methyltransferase
MINALEQKLLQADAPTNIDPLCIMLLEADDPPAAKSALQGPRQKFDLIISHLTLHHIPDMSPLLRTMLGCLAPLGVVALTDFEDFGPEARKFHPEAKMLGVERHGIPLKDMEAMMTSVGFADVKVEVGWTMRKEIEAWPGEWGQKRPTVEERDGKPLEEMDFPFLVCMGGRS